MHRPRKLQCCRCWRNGVPPMWLLVGAAVIVQIGFGAYPVVIKKFAQQNSANPIIFSFYRDVICAPVLFICAFVAERRIIIPSLSALLVFLLLGLLGMFGNQLLYILGVYLAGANIASAFQPIIPVWTSIFGLFVCVEKLISPVYLHMWTKGIGVLLAADPHADQSVDEEFTNLAEQSKSMVHPVSLNTPASYGNSNLIASTPFSGGAIEITLIGSDLGGSGNSSSASGGNSSSASTHGVSNFVLGCFCLTANTICMAFYVLMQKKFVFNRPNFKLRNYPVAVTAWSYFFGAVFMGLASLYLIPLKKTSDYLLPAESLPALVFAVFVTSALCYLLITWTTMYLSALIATIFWPVQVLVTVVMSYFLIGEKLLPLQYVGAVMLLMGLGLVLFSNHLDERLVAGKRVVRLDCYCKEVKAVPRSHSSSTIGDDEDEDKSLLSSSSGYHVSKVSTDEDSDESVRRISPEKKSINN